MRGKRIFFFLIMIAVGAALGLLYGWVIHPMQDQDSSPDMLRSDYKADYVLMVAEIYHADQNLDEAVRRLEMVSSLSPERTLAEAVLAGQQLGYAEENLGRLEELALALRSRAATPASGGQP